MKIMKEDTKILPDKTGTPWLDKVIEVANTITRRLLQEIQKECDSEEKSLSSSKGKTLV